MSHHEVDPIETLRAELSRVHVSPDFAERVRRQIGDDVIASIGAELSDLSVSPAFPVRVRQQIDEAPARSRWFGLFDWRWAVPAAAAAVVLIAVVLSRGGNPGTPDVAPVVVTARAPESPSAPAAAASLPPTAQSAPGASAPLTMQSAPVQVAPRTPAPPAASSQQTEEKFEVITNQPAILQDWWARVAAGQPLSDVTDETVAADMDTREVVVSPVEVNPLVVKWLVEPPATAAIPFPFIRRVAAEWAERSSR